MRRLVENRGSMPMRATLALAAVTLVIGFVAVPGTAQIGGPGAAFTGTASARLVGVDVRLSPTIGFDPLFDGGAAVAQAQLDSRGTSKAFASTAYPGNVVITLPGTISVLTKGQIPADDLPPYPLYVDSAHPTMPEERLTAGVYDLSAASNSVDSSATATDGLTRGTARVSFDPGTKETVSRAETSIGAIRINDALTVNGVRSAAEVRQIAGGELQRTSTFEVAALTILGQRIAVTEKGLSLLGMEVPLGGLLTDLLTPLLSQLTALGTTVEVLPSEELEDGVTSAGLRISTTQKAPPQLASGIDEVTVVITLGAVTASVSNRALPSPSVGGKVAPVTPAGTATGSGRGAAPAAGSTGARGGTTTGTGGSQATAPLAAVTPSAPVESSLIAALPADISAGGIYPLLVIAGVLLFGAARLFPFLARRTS